MSHFSSPLQHFGGHQPELQVLSADPELKAQHEAWSASRLQFNADLKQPGSEAQAEKWQKLYYRGLNPEGRATEIQEHRTRLKLKPFKPRSGSSGQA